MSFPEPIWCEDQEFLYKQACFFYDQYERVFRELRTLQSKEAARARLRNRPVHLGKVRRNR